MRRWTSWRKRIERYLNGDRTVFLFGAGASAYSQPLGPPVGNKLFTLLQVQPYSVTANLSSYVISAFSRSFEEGVDAMWNGESRYLLPLLRETAVYLAQFRPSEGNLYRKLIRHVVNSRMRAVFTTINYDMLIELSALAEGQNVAYHARSVPYGSVPVIKIHGSINFLPVADIQGIGFDLGPGNWAVECPMRSVASPDEVVDWCNGGTSLAPVIALYTNKKPFMVSRIAIQEHQREWFRVMSDVDRVFVVGVHLHPEDHHIWDVLRNCKAEVNYVGPEGEEVVRWAQSQGRASFHHFAKDFKEAVRLMTA